MRRWPEQHGRNDCTRNYATHEHVGRFAARDVHEQHAQDRAQHGNSTENERVNDDCRITRQSERTDQDRADQAHRVSFEHVGGHAGAITHVVADIICDRRGIARIVFFEAYFDFANEVRADISGFGVNPAAQSREHADQARPKCQAHQAADRHPRTGDMRDNGVKNRDRQKRKSDYEQPRDGTSVESHSECFRNRYRCGLRGSHVGNHRDSHANVTGRKRTERAD